MNLLKSTLAILLVYVWGEKKDGVAWKRGEEIWYHKDPSPGVPCPSPIYPPIFCPPSPRQWHTSTTNLPVLMEACGVAAASTVLLPICSSNGPEAHDSGPAFTQQHKPPIRLLSCLKLGKMVPVVKHCNYTNRLAKIKVKITPNCCIDVARLQPH